MNSRKTLFSPALFRHDVSRYKGLLIAFGIILFLSGPFIIIFAVSLTPSGENSIFTGAEVRAALDEISGIVMMMCGRFSIIAGAITACVVASRFDRKSSAYFYTSLPVSKEAKYVTDTVCGISIYAVCLAVNALIAWCVLALSGWGITAWSASFLFSLTWQGIAYFIISYSIYSLAGQICATVFAQVVLGVTLAYYLPAVSLIIDLAFGTFVKGHSTLYYMKYLTALSPMTSLYGETLGIEGIYASPIWVWLVFAAIALVLSCVIFTKRKTENAGEAVSVLWGRYFVRALYIFPSSICGAIIFYNVSSGNVVWTAVGFAVFAVLPHIVINAVIFKNASKLFYGIISFAVICVAAALTLTFIRFDVFGVMKTPDAGDARKISVEGLGEIREFTTENPETIEKILSVVGDESRYDDDSMEYYVTAVYHRNFGLPVAKSFYINLSESDVRTVEEIVASKEYKDYCYKKTYEKLLAEIEGKSEFEAVCEYTEAPHGAASPDKDELVARLKEDLYSSPHISEGAEYLCTLFFKPSGNNIVSLTAYYEDNQYVNRSYDGYYVWVYSDLTKTVEYLEKCGYVLGEEDLKAQAVQISSNNLGVVKTYVKGGDGFEDVLNYALECRSVYYHYPLYTESGTVTVTLENGGKFTVESYIDYAYEKKEAVPEEFSEV